MPRSELSEMREEDEIQIAAIEEINDPKTKNVSCKFSSITSNKNKEKRKHNRTAMGEYIVPHGGKPLTSLVETTPGPKYLPCLDSSKYTGPQYSLSGPHIYKIETFPAAPSDLNIRASMEWKDKTINVKGKGTTRPYNVRDKAHENDSIGPGRYNVRENKNTLNWEKSPQWTLKNRHRDGVNAGPPNNQIKPTDTHRDPVPPPNTYRPNSSYSRSEFKGKGVEHSFGSPRVIIEPDYPGPTDYDVNVDTSGEPGKTFGLKLPPIWNQQKDLQSLGPGPGAYKLETCIGNGLSKTIGELPPDVDWDPAAPPPNIYAIPDLLGSFDPPHTALVNWRPFTPKGKPQPGPDSYNLTKADLPKLPEYSFRGQTKPTFPDILNYPNLASKSNGWNPGPGKYEQTTGTVNTNKEPKYSMGRVLKEKKEKFPGPGHYSLRQAVAPHAPKGPSFSFGSRTKTIDKKVSPGPAAYFPKPERSDVKFSMLHRPKQRIYDKTPAPNEYKPPSGQTRKGPQTQQGISMKSRPSPFVYSGRKGTQLIEAAA